MGWDSLRKSIAGFDQTVTRLGVSISDDAPNTKHLNLARRFLHDQEKLAESAFMKIWDNDSFMDTYNSLLVAKRLTSAVCALKDQQDGPLRKRLCQILRGPLVQDFQPEQAKDFFYELEVASALTRCGFEVSLREPDVVVEGNGLSQKLGLACKYPSSEAQIHSHISKGYRQLSSQDIPGCVMIGMDIIIIKKAFGTLPKCLDFRQPTRDPRKEVGDLLSAEIQNLVVQRANDYPAERPLDGCILSLSLHGVYGKPAAITSLNSWVVQCDASNTALKDLGLLTGQLGLLDGKVS